MLLAFAIGIFNILNGCYVMLYSCATEIWCMHESLRYQLWEAHVAMDVNMYCSCMVSLVCTQIMLVTAVHKDVMVVVTVLMDNVIVSRASLAGIVNTVSTHHLSYTS